MPRSTVILWPIFLLFLALPTKSWPFYEFNRCFGSNYIFKLITEHCEKIFTNSKATALLMAYLFGHKNLLLPTIKKSYQMLNLIHLFSPSGLHLSSALFLFLPFSWMGKKSKQIATLMKLFLLILLFFIPKFYALKRMAFLKIGQILNIKFNLNLEPLYIFFLVFIIDLTFGTFKYSPVGFLISFLFIGLLIINNHRAKIVMIFYLIFAQMICSTFLKQPFYPLSIFFSLFLTSVFVVIFPVVIALFILSFIITTGPLLQVLLITYNSMVYGVSHIVSLVPPINISNEVILGTLLLISLQKKRHKMILSLLIFFIY